MRDLPRREREEETDDPHSEGHGGHLRVVDIRHGRSYFWVGAVFIFVRLEIELHPSAEGMLVKITKRNGDEMKRLEGKNRPRRVSACRADVGTG